MDVKGRKLQTVTIIVKYFYSETVPIIPGTSPDRGLAHITLLCLPNGALQEIYNPSAAVPSFWQVGRHAPSRDEEFRVRINIKALAARAAWRVVHIQAPSAVSAA